MNGYSIFPGVLPSSKEKLKKMLMQYANAEKGDNCTLLFQAG